MLLLLTLLSLCLAQDVEFGFQPAIAPGEKPTLVIYPASPCSLIVIQVEAGDQVFDFERTGVGSETTVSWPRDESVTSATVYLRADFADGHDGTYEVPVEYSYGGKLEIDLSQATADAKAKTVTVWVSQTVNRADITAYGAGKAVLDQRTVQLGEVGPGPVDIPWIGSVSEVVLLDVKLHTRNAWAGFTYSPWFLDIPHEEVLFETDKATVLPSEEPKLQATLKQLQDVLDKYGDIVPVKLYIAGCTDTVGDKAHNKTLSERRARAIASWLREHGYHHPIFYYGFGEDLLAIPTDDSVDNATNRRVLYMVGANPPPAGTDVPTVSWREL